MLMTGQIITVMYPYDINWWKTDGFVTGYDSDNCYKIEDLDGNKISIDIRFLKY